MNSVRGYAVASLMVIITGCGRDALLEALEPVTGSPDVASAEAGPRDLAEGRPADGGRTSDLGLLADVGDQTDFAVAFDIGASPDTGILPDSGSRADFGSPRDSGFFRDIGSPRDFGSTTDSGVARDLGPRADAGPIRDSGVLRDAGVPSDLGVVVDAGGSPDGGVSIDLGTRLDMGVSSDSGADPDLGPADSGLTDAGTPPCPGNTCRAPIPLTGAVGIQTVVGNTTCAANEATLSCGASAAKDVVHRLSVSNRRRVVVRSNSVRGGFTSALALRASCDLANTELTCDAGGAGLSALDRFVDPGTYFVWLDGATTTASGNYRLDVEIDPQDTCLDPIPVTLPPVGTSIIVSGDTVGAADTFQASCAGQARSPDHVLALEATAQVDLVAETLSPTTGSQYDTALHLRSRCTSGLGSPELACDDDRGSGQLSRLEVSLSTGTYYLVVDGFGARSSGGYQLRLTTR